MQHNFAESLSFSHDQADLPMWGEVYRNAFPTFAGMTCVRSDGWAQRGGIDRVVTLSSGKSLHIDEKVRKKDYGDILIEYWSDEERRVPGWIAKDLACDFIAYAFLPSRTCYLLPFHQLRLAWKNNGKEWVGRYKKTVADNGSYQTVGVAVPIPELLDKIKRAMVITWQESAQ